MKKLPLQYLLPVLSLCVLVGATPASADFAAKDWPLQKPIILPAGAADYVKVPLDNQILAGAQSNLGDLRVISPAGIENNYQIVTNDGSVSRGQYPADMLNLVNNGVVPAFILDLGQAGLVHAGITISSDSLNYKRQVTVYGADTLFPASGSGWEKLTERGYVYGYYDTRANFRAQSGEVSYPSASFRYLKVVVAPGEGEMKVTGATVLRSDSVPAVTSFVSPTMQSSEDSAKRTTELVLDLGQPGLPTTKVTLGLADTTEEFSRSATVSESADGKNWRPINNGYIFNLRTPRFNGSNRTLAYPESRLRYIKVTVFNDDNRPVAFNGAVLEQIETDIVFKATPGSSYILYYGNPAARTPVYELSRYFQYLDTATMPEAKFGPEEKNGSYVTPPPHLAPFSERHPNVLNAVLVLLVVVAFGLIVFYMKDLSKSHE